MHFSTATASPTTHSYLIVMDPPISRINPFSFINIKRWWFPPRNTRLVRSHITFQTGAITPVYHGASITAPMVQGIRTQRLLLVSGAIVLANVMVSRVAVTTNTRPERLVAAARTPSPASTLRNRQVVVAEGEEGGDEPDDVAEEDIETVMAEVEPARGCDEDGREPRDDADQQQIEWWRGGLAAHGGHRARVLRKTLLLDYAAAAARVGAPAS